MFGAAAFSVWFGRVCSVLFTDTGALVPHG